jgi:riboflavin synthase
MFTGIIEATGIVTDIIISGSNKSFWIESAISAELEIDQSVSHNGACLTVEKIENSRHHVTAIEETLVKTNLNRWIKGSIINLERCLTLSSRLDGHVVQGHVDAVATCTTIVEKNGSKEFTFKFDKKSASLIIEKGSITINGISLTVFNVEEDQFTVAIIPYTFEHTNIKELQTGDDVNIEFDMIGKYVNRIMQFKRG